MKIVCIECRWLLAVSLVCLAVGFGQNVQAEDFKPLANGKDLTGWDGNPDFWSVQDGVITGQTTPEKPTKGNTFLIWRDGEVGDFELKAEYKIQGGNSGIQYRSKEVSKWVIGGYQADIDAAGQWAGTNYEEKGRGVLAARGQKVTIDQEGKKTAESLGDSAELKKVLKDGDWNLYELTVKGNHLIQKINGQVMSEVIDNQPNKLAKTGLLALQLHAGPPMTIQFRNIQLKTLKSE